MNPLPITATRQLLSFTSRRGLLAAATAGLLAALPFANGGTGSEAKKRRKRKKKGAFFPFAPAAEARFTAIVKT